MQASRVARAIAIVGGLLHSPLSAAERDAQGTHSLVKGTPSTRGTAFIQAKPASLSYEGYELSLASEELEACRARVAELDEKLEDLRKQLRAAEKCQGPRTCAIFGDPHFTTFDGAHTILMQEKTLWAVKSQNIWIQALSRENTGDLMGLAVSGPFMHGHTLMFVNTSLVTEEAAEQPFTVLFNDKPILDKLDDEGSGEFELQNILWAARRTDWNLLLHGQQILDMEDVIDFDVGSWESRFSGKPKGGIYLFKLPEGVELTATGADLMSAVVKMSPQEGGQSGYCGNFNGEAEDDFRPPEEGTVPENLVPAWNIPVGEGLEPVPERLDLFRTSTYLKKLFPAPAHAPASSMSRSSGPPPCSQEDLRKAGAACSKVAADAALHAACVLDFCESGDPAVADGVLAVGMMNGELQATSS